MPAALVLPDPGNPVGIPKLEELFSLDGLSLALRGPPGHRRSPNGLGLRVDANDFRARLFHPSHPLVQPEKCLEGSSPDLAVRGFSPANRPQHCPDDVGV